MGGFFGVASKTDCTSDVFFGTDYHSHLGTYRGGLCFYNGDSFERSIHNIQNSPFRTKFERDIGEFKGHMGIGCISDSDPQPVLIAARWGTFAIVTVGNIINQEELVRMVLEEHRGHFFELSGARINATELVAALIAHKDNMLEGIKYAQEMIEGSISLLAMAPEGIYAARDNCGRTPVRVGHKEGAFCASFENFGYFNIGYRDYMELAPGEIVLLRSDRVQKLHSPASTKCRICAFLWTYYGYPTSSYEGINVEEMRYRCGAILARHDGDIDIDAVAGVPDSGTAHAIGYANVSDAPFARPLIKYTPTWPRSFTPQDQSMRNIIARMKLVPVETLIEGKRLLLVDDSIVRGTQMRETSQYLYHNGAKQVHIRSACPPIMYSCKYLNFSRSTNVEELAARRVVKQCEGTAEPGEEVLQKYTDPATNEYAQLEKHVARMLGVDTVRYQTLPGLLEAIGIDPENVCTYCWDGRE